MPPTAQQRLGLLEVERVETFSEPPVSQSKQFAGLLRLSLVAPEPKRLRASYWRIQRAIAGPGLLLHETASASPFFEMAIVPLGHVTEASISPRSQVRLHPSLPPQESCRTT
jgi:hypothetical protein